MKNLTDLAERIYKANKTLSNNTELIKLVGRHDSPESLCLSAARIILSGKGKLSFI